MTTTIDIHDLEDEEIKKVQEFVNHLREKKYVYAKGELNIVDLEPLKTRQLGVKGNVTRKEIYDHI